MRPGIRAEDVGIGIGDEAVRGKVAIINLRIFLPGGTELPESSMPRSRLRIDLSRRDCIAGVRYGIEGMRVGGRRVLIISPHLAYGAKGVPGRIPPNAMLRCEIELLEVRERGAVNPEDYLPGRQLSVLWLGDLQNGVGRWQFDLHEDGRCGAMVTIPISGLKWRHARSKQASAQIDPQRVLALIREAETLPERCPADCLNAARVCVDHAGRDGGVHRNPATDELCLAVTLSELGHQVSYFFGERSSAWRNSALCTLVEEVIAPILDSGRKAGR